jgi:hypothetical protein
MAYIAGWPAFRITGEIAEKLKSKTRAGSKEIKVYDEPRSPFQRLTENSGLLQAYKDTFNMRHFVVKKAALSCFFRFPPGRPEQGRITTTNLWFDLTNTTNKQDLKNFHRKGASNQRFAVE